MRTILLLLVIVLNGERPVVAGPGEVRTGAPRSESPQSVDSWRIVAQLTRKAAHTWRVDRTFARQQSDYAARNNLSLPNEELIRLLSRRINPDTAIEGYVKWQLLSFDSDLSRATADELRRIVKVWPRVLAQVPVLAGAFDPTLSVANSGAVVDARRPASRRTSDT